MGTCCALLCALEPTPPFSMESVQTFGRKKNAVAVAFVKRGRGLLKINGKPIELCEPEILRYKVFEPVLLLGKERPLRGQEVRWPWRPRALPEVVPVDAFRRPRARPRARERPNGRRGATKTTTQQLGGCRRAHTHAAEPRTVP